MTPIEKARNKAEAISLLGLSGSETFGEIRRAWKRKAIETHPDHLDGSADAFLKVKAAFDLLCADQDDSDRISRVMPQRPGQMGRPTSKVQTLTPEEQAECFALLASQQETGTTDHVAEEIQCQGRNLTYIVASQATAGQNRVALPADVLVTKRTVSPKIVSFELSQPSAGDVLVPETTRREIFPGARSVRIRFCPTLQRH